MAESYGQLLSWPGSEPAIPGLDYPNVSAGGKGFENIREFRLKVMAGLDPAIQRLN